VAEVSAAKYHVILSYSKADEAWGDWLRVALEVSRVDKKVVAPEGLISRSLRSIFRNREHVSWVSALLDRRRLASLRASQFLVVLCSPSAAKCAVVNQEIRCFKQMNRADRVIPVIVGSDPERESIPRELSFRLGWDGLLTDQRGCPAADARPEGDGKALALQKVVEGVLGRSGDESARATAAGHRQQAIIRWVVAAGLPALLVCAGFALARYELARHDVLLDRILAQVTAFTGAAVAVSSSIGVPRSLSLVIVQASEHLFRDIAELGHDTPSLRLHKALMLIDFAHVHGALGSKELERDRASEASRLLQGLADEIPIDAAWERELSIAYVRLGDLLKAQGRFTEALADYGASREIIEEYATASSYAERLRELFIKMGDVDVARGFFDEALATYGKGLAIAMRLVADEPGNALWQHGLVQSHAKMGDVLQLQGNLDEALVSYASSRAIAEGVLTIDPGHVEGQRGLAAAHFKTGEILGLQGKPDEALASYRASNDAIAQEFGAVDRSNPDWQHNLGTTHYRIGSILETRNEVIAALAEYRTALAIATRFITADPDNIIWQLNVGHTHEHIGGVLQSLGDLAGAMKAYEAKRSIIARIAAADPGNVTWQYELGISHARIGYVLEARGDFAAAVEEYETCLAIAKDIADLDDDHAQAQRNIAVTYGKLATAHHWLGKTGQALAELRQAREMMAALLATAPAIKLLTDDLAQLDGRIAALEGRAQVGTKSSPTVTSAPSMTISTPLERPIEPLPLPEKAVAHPCEGACANETNGLAGAAILTGGSAGITVRPRPRGDLDQ